MIKDKNLKRYLTGAGLDTIGNNVELITRINANFHDHGEVFREEKDKVLVCFDDKSANKCKFFAKSLALYS